MHFVAYKQQGIIFYHILLFIAPNLITNKHSVLMRPTVVLAYSLYMLEVFFDGLCIPNHRYGIACYGYLIKKDDDGKVIIYSDKGVVSKPFSDEATNNVAEYTALIKSFQWLKENGDAKPVVLEIINVPCP